MAIAPAAGWLAYVAGTVQPLGTSQPITAADPLIVAALLARPILAVIYAITAAVSVWLFRDARRRGRSVVVAAGWAVGGLVLPTIVHFVYLYGRLKTDGSMTGPPLDREE